MAYTNLCVGLCVGWLIGADVSTATGWSKKNGATLHFPKYLEN